MIIMSKTWLSTRPLSKLMQIGEEGFEKEVSMVGWGGLKVHFNVKPSLSFHKHWKSKCHKGLYLPALEARSYVGNISARHSPQA